MTCELEADMTTVIGVFDNDSDLEVALNRLYEKGFNDVRVVDRGLKSGPETVIPAAFAPGNNLSIGGTTANGAYPGAVLVPGFVGLDDQAVNSAYLLDNLDVELSDEAADFYANAVRNGGKLLIAETDDDHSDMVWSVMRNSNASQYTRPENA
jgi:hypothetical protein